MKKSPPPKKLTPKERLEAATKNHEAIQAAEVELYKGVFGGDTAGSMIYAEIEFESGQDDGS